MDNLRPLDAAPVTGRLDQAIERALTTAPGQLDRMSRSIVESQFPSTVAPDVLAAVGLDPELALSGGAGRAAAGDQRWRNSARSWPPATIRAPFCR